MREAEERWASVRAREGEELIGEFIETLAGASGW
jgi:hypothetical protein